jgi:hypothetical protein
MRYWQSSHAPSAPAMVGADGLHMTDAGYECLATDLAAALGTNWRFQAKFALRAQGATASVAALPAQPGSAPRVARAPADMRRNDATPFN